MTGTRFSNLDTIKRSILPIIAALLSVFFLVISFTVSAWWLIALFFTVPLVVLGFYDYAQDNKVLRRNFPTSARIRDLFLQLRPYLRAYIVEDDLEGKPFSFEARQLVHSRARGEGDTHPFGTEHDTDSYHYEWMNHSITPAEEPEKSPRIKVGNEQCSQPYEVSVLNISAMSFGSLSGKAVETLNKAAKEGDFYQDTGEGGISPYHLKHGGDLVFEIGTGYFGARTKQGGFDADIFAEQAQRDVVKMTELKLSQGAKPGHGGMISAKKVTPEIAEIRGIPVHQDFSSPRGHQVFSTPVGLLEFCARMRDLSGGKPVGFKLCVGHIHEVFAIMKAMQATQIYPDYIVVDGGEGGTGGAPVEMSDRLGMPLIDGLVLMRNALVGAGLRDKVRLVASGKIYSGATLAKSLALGADWCNAARAFMFSIGCVQSQRCHTGLCPTGITTQDEGRQRGLVVDIQAERAARFHEKTVKSLVDLTAAVGVKHPRDLKPHHLVHRLGAEGASIMDNVHDFIEANSLNDAASDTRYGPWWQAASADTFEPQCDISELRSKAKVIH